MLIFDSNIHNGSLLDKMSSTPMTNSGAKFRWDGKKFVADFNGTSSYMGLPTLPAFGTGDFSVVMRIKLNNLSTTQSLISGAANSFTLFITANTGKLVQYKTNDNGIPSQIAIKAGNEYVVAYKRSGTVGTYYIDGIADATTITDTYNYSIKSSELGRYTLTNLPLNGSISSCRIFSHALSASEIASETEYANNLRCAVKPKRGFVRQRPTDLSQFKGTGINQGMVLASNFYNHAGVVTDISGNLKNGTATNCINTKDGLALYGINSKVSFGNIGNVKSVSFRIKPASTTCKILEGRANAALVYINSGTLTASDFANIYIDGIAGATMAANKWQTVTLTSASDIAFSELTLGLNNTTYGAFEVADLRAWNRQISITEAKQYHNSFVQNYIIEDFSDLDCSGNNVTPKGMIQGTGLFKGIQLANDVISGGLRLKKYQKGIECTSGGTIIIPSRQASGVWRFKWMKGADANLLKMYFIINNSRDITVNNTYIFSFSNLEKITLIGDGSYLCYTVDSYIQNNIIYECEIRRSNSGQFTLLIRGGSFVASAGYDGWTLINVVGGLGSNPVLDATYNSSNYIVISAGVGDRVYGIEAIDGIKQL